MKKIGFLIMLMLFLFMGCIETEEKTAVSLSITSSEISLNIGDIETLKAVIEYDDLSRENLVNWSVEDDSIATIDELTGVITALAPGKVKVIAEKNGLTDSVSITVLPKSKNLISREITFTKNRIDIGEETILQIKEKYDDNTTEYTIADWSSEDENIATVNSNGKVKGISEGKVKIYASISGKTYLIEITVNDNIEVTIIGIEIEELNYLVKVGNDYKLEAFLKYSDGTKELADVEWISLNTNIATITNNGDFNTLKKGKVIFRANYEIYLEEIEVEVLELPVLPESIKIISDLSSISINDTFILKLEITYNDESKEYEEGNWKISNNNLEKDESINGKFIAKKAGETKISISKYNFNEEFNIIILEEKVEPVKIEIIAPTKKIFEGDTYPLEAKVIYNNGTDDNNVLWSVNDESLASIDSLGLLMAISPGIVTVKAEKGKIFEELELYINPIDVIVTDVKIKNKIEELEIEEKHTYIIEVTYSDGEVKEENLELNSNNSKVDINNGEIEALEAGEVIITVEKDGKSDSDEITINPLPVTVTKVEILSGDIELEEEEIKEIKIEVTYSDGNKELEKLAFESSNESIVEVNLQENVIEAKKEGTATITIEKDGESDSIQVTVKKLPIEGIKIHYQRTDGNYEGWGLHVWGDNVVKLTEWEIPILFTETDDWGGVLTLIGEDNSSQINILTHKTGGDPKDGEKKLLPTLGKEFWLLEGDDNVYSSKPVKAKYRDPENDINNLNEPRTENKMVIYQMMTRLFANTKTTNRKNGTKEENGVGTFNDINDTALLSLKDLGVSHVWYTGVIEHATMTDNTEHGIELDDSDVIKGRAGSPYAIKDYYDVNPDLAENKDKRIEEFEELVKRTHDNGMKVIIDFVPNHVARNYKSDKKPDGIKDLGEGDNTGLGTDDNNNFYYLVGQSFNVPNGYNPLGGEQGPNEDGRFEENPAKVTGNDIWESTPDVNTWFETVKLNYGSNTKNKMKAILAYWVNKGVDGFRCDMAEMVPVDFWGWVIPEMKKINPDVIFIAEIYNPSAYSNYLNNGKFDFLYDKVGMYDETRELMAGNGGADKLRRGWNAETKGYTSKMLFFLENHDEQRIASDGFAGDAKTGIPGMTVSATMTTGPVMVYFGQEVGEPGSGSEGFGGEDGRTTIFDYWGVPEHQKWINDGKYDGGQLSSDQKELRSFYKNLLNTTLNHEAITKGGFYELFYLHDNGQSEGYNDKLYSYIRYTNGKAVLVLANFDRYSSVNTKIKIPEKAWGLMGMTAEGEYTFTDLLGSGEVLKVNAEDTIEFKNSSARIPITIAPNSAYIFDITK